MQFHRPSVQSLMALLFTYANLILPWEFRPSQDAFYGSLNWGTIEFDWDHDVRPVATVKVRGRDDQVKLEYSFDSISVHSESPDEDAAACVAPRQVESWVRWLLMGVLVATAGVFVLSLPVSAFVFVWLVWYFTKQAFAAVFGGPSEEKSTAAVPMKKVD